MTHMRMVGRYPDGDSSLVTRQYVDDRATSVGVSTNQIDNEIELRSGNLATIEQAGDLIQGKVGDSELASSAAGYYNTTDLGSTPGLAKLSSDGTIPSSYYYFATLENTPRYFHNTSGNSGNVSTGYVQIGSITVNAPYRYMPMFYGNVETRADGGSRVPVISVETSAGVRVAYTYHGEQDSSRFRGVPIIPDMSVVQSSYPDGFTGSTTFYVRMRRLGTISKVYATSSFRHLVATLIPV